MKRIFFFVGFLLAASIATFAQVKLTPMAGLNISSFSYTAPDETPDGFEEPDFNSRIGFQIGAMARFGLSDNLFVRPGLLFSQKGATTEDEADNADVTAKSNTSLNYLELPLHVGYEVNVSEDMGILFEVGPYFSYMLGGNTSFEIEGDDAVGEAPDDVTIEAGEFPADGGEENTGYLNPLDVGVNIGAGATISNFYVGLFYGLGITNIQPFLEEEPDGYERSEQAQLRNGNFQVKLGYTLPLGE